MLIAIHHESSFRYPVPATDSHNELRLQPISDDHQRLVQFALTIEPKTPVLEYTTPWGTVHHFDIQTPHSELRINAESVVETLNGNPFEKLNLISDDWQYYKGGEARSQFAEYLGPTRLSGFEAEIAVISERAHSDSDPGVAAFLIALSAFLFESFGYDPDATHVRSTLREVLDRKAGVCQDFAHLMLAVARWQGIPARYVSGYVVSRADGEHLHGDEAMHAWVECAMPDGRWQGFDPTNNLLANEQYVKVHVGRDYADASPIRGIYHGITAAEMSVRVSVQAQNGVSQQAQSQNQ